MAVSLAIHYPDTQSFPWGRADTITLHTTYLISFTDITICEIQGELVSFTHTISPLLTDKVQLHQGHTCSIHPTSPYILVYGTPNLRYHRRRHADISPSNTLWNDAQFIIQLTRDSTVTVIMETNITNILHTAFWRACAGYSMLEKIWFFWNVKKNTKEVLLSVQN